MFRRKILAILLVAGFFVISNGKVEAVTCGKYIGIEQSDGTVKEGTTYREVNEGQSICDKYSEYDVNSRSYLVWPKLLTCQSDGTFKDTTKSVCVCVDNNDGAAFCGTTTDYTCSSSNGKTSSATLKGNETGCMGFQDYGKCNGATGQMEKLGSCSEGEYCQDTWYWLFGTVNYYSCKKANCNMSGVTANMGDVKCIGTSVYKCGNNGNFDFQKSCDGGTCIDDPVNGATCANQGNAGTTCKTAISDTGTNLTISESGVLVDRSTCYKDKIYKCNTVPTFDFEKDCAAEGKVCYTKTGEKYAACDTKENVDKMTGVISTTTSSETILDSADFTCSTTDGSKGISTALGCVPVEMGKFVPWLLSWLFGVAGGIAFLLMAYGFILIATSSGDEKKVQGAKETITSAVIGLLVCIFAVFILRLVAVNILNIPGIN